MRNVRDITPRLALRQRIAQATASAINCAREAAARHDDERTALALIRAAAKYAGRAEELRALEARQ